GLPACGIHEDTRRPSMRRLSTVAALLGVALTFAGVHSAAASAGGCRPLDAVFYSAMDHVRLAQRLAANASPCADYSISISPRDTDKTAMRPGNPAGIIRALGPEMHAA